MSLVIRIYLTSLLIKCGDKYNYLILSLLWIILSGKKKTTNACWNTKKKHNQSLSQRSEPFHTPYWHDVCNDFFADSYNFNILVHSFYSWCESVMPYENQMNKIKSYWDTLWSNTCSTVHTFTLALFVSVCIFTGLNSLKVFCKSTM